jgi:hypothetical protein
MLKQDRLRVDLDRSAFRSGKDQQVFDQAPQVLGLVADVAGELGPARLVQPGT